VHVKPSKGPGRDPERRLHGELPRLRRQQERVLAAGHLTVAHDLAIATLQLRGDWVAKVSSR